MAGFRAIAPPAPNLLFLAGAAAALKQCLAAGPAPGDGVADLLAIFDAAACSVSKLWTLEFRDAQGWLTQRF